jgi:hypothetical protein
VGSDAGTGPKTSVLSDDGKLAAEKLSARRFRIINNPRLSNFQLSAGGFLKGFFSENELARSKLGGIRT